METVTYKIWDSETKQFLQKPYFDRRKAARAADLKNFNWGATRYFARIER